MNPISVGTTLAARAAHAGQVMLACNDQHAPPERSGRIDARSLSYAAQAKGAAHGRGLRPAWVRGETDVSLEKLLLLLLAVAAVFGIAYAFSCFLDLVQRWAVTERAMSGLI